MKDNIIEIRDLKKKYQLGAIGGRTLTGDIQSWLARIRGKENPNMMVGVDSSRRGEEFWALKGINLSIQSGDRLGIIGTNGAGKSTLLKILSRVTAPTEGEISVFGRITSMLEVGTGFHGELTGRENIYLNGAILGMKKAEIDKKMNDIIGFSECAQFIDTPVKRYSSGMYVKLAFSVAAHLDSDIMIMDEVLAVGDVAFQRKCLDKMAEIAETQGKTILYVSHNMSTIRRLCNRCIVLDQGELVYQGGIEEAIQRYLRVSDECSLHNNLSERRVIDEQFNNKAEMLSLDLMERDNNQIEYGEKIKFCLKYRCKEELNNVCLRLIVSLKDDTRIGTTFSPIIEHCECDKIYSMICEFDSSQIAPGRYGVNLILFSTDGAGNQEKLDFVMNAFNFEIVRTKGQFYNMAWDRNSWGNIAFPALSMKGK